MKFRVTDRWAPSFEAASFDEYEVYNLNGPFLQVAVDHQRDAGESWRAFARYQLLLGFGRPNEISVGAEIKVTR
jgi:hypothetical protein